jgi:hypothetical protein
MPVPPFPVVAQEAESMVITPIIAQKVFFTLFPFKFDVWHPCAAILIIFISCVVGLDKTPLNLK